MDAAGRDINDLTDIIAAGHAETEQPRETRPLMSDLLTYKVADQASGSNTAMPEAPTWHKEMMLQSRNKIMNIKSVD